jgi:integrase
VVVFVDTSTNWFERPKKEEVMASVHRRKDSKYWHGYFRDSDGKLIDRSTRLTNRKKALKVAEEFEAVAQKRKNSALVKATFAELLKDAFGEELPISTVSTFGITWLKTKKPETSPATFISYQKTISTFVEFLGEKANRDLTEISRRDLIDFRNDLAGKVASGTVNKAMKTLRTFFKAAERDKFIQENPAEFVDHVKSSPVAEERRPFTIPEIQAVLSVADPEWQSLIRFGLYSGQRLGDLASLTWANVDLTRGELRLTTQKTGKRIIVPLGDALRAHIMSLGAADSLETPIHPRAYETTQRDSKVTALSGEFSNLLAQAGLKPKRSHKGGGSGADGKRAVSVLSFHSLRHTAVSLLKDAGIPQAAVQELIGHDTEAMSAQYTHVGRESLLKAANALPTL